jgi:rhamnosyl/mannosyltransferase
MHWFLRKADVIIASSPTYAASSRILTQYRHKVKVIPFGLEEKALLSLDRDNLEQWQTKLGKDFFLFVGVFRYYKGLKYLLDAARGQNFKVIIAGDGPESKSLLEYKRQHKIDNVEFIGNINDRDKVSLLNLCRALVLPSHLRAEAFGLVLLEAMMFKRPIICCKLDSGMDYINRDGVTGHLVRPADARSLRNAIQSLHKNPETAQVMGLSARQRYEDLFMPGPMVDQVTDLYKMILK